MSLDVLLVAPPSVAAKPFDKNGGMTLPLGLGYLAAVLEQALLLPAGEVGPMVHDHRVVERKLGPEAAEAVLQRADGLVVPGRHVLGVDPADPGGGEAAGRGFMR